MIITIDGPAGTGKSTAARGLAERLQFAYLDTGAMYRAVGLACLQQRVDLHDTLACARVAEAVSIHVDGRATWLDRTDVTEAIRSPEATAAASIVAQIPAIRTRLVTFQRNTAAQGKYVCEGRDQGTVVFPAAEAKFFLTAAPEIRAERRRLELTQKGESITLEELLAQQSERDARDQQRAVAPLRMADDAIEIDTSTLSTEQVIDTMVSHVIRLGLIQQTP